jgi:hypothetical protein
VALAAFNAIEVLGPKAGALRAYARTVNPQAAVPDARYDSYIPRLIQNLGDGAPAPAAAKEKKKKKSG